MLLLLQLKYILVGVGWLEVGQLSLNSKILVLLNLLHKFNKLEKKKLQV